MKVIDSALKKEDLSILGNIINSIDFPWYYNNYQVPEEKDSSFLFHSFFHSNGINSKYFFIVKPILKILNCVVIINIRANLLLKRSEFKSNYHIDRWGFNKPKHKTAIFYVNTNNGHTLFKNNNKKIKCVENKLIIFDSKLSHKTVLQTDKDKRIVINFNYFDSDL
jgi:hypothetical protein